MGVGWLEHGSEAVERLRAHLLVGAEPAPRLPFVLGQEFQRQIQICGRGRQDPVRPRQPPEAAAGYEVMGSDMNGVAVLLMFLLEDIGMRDVMMYELYKWTLFPFFLLMFGCGLVYLPVFLLSGW